MQSRIKITVKFSVVFFMTVFFTVNAVSKSLEARFIGNEAFWISDGDYSLMTDFPYKSGIYDTMTYDFNFGEVKGNVLSLVSNRHEDHFDPMLFIDQNWMIAGPREVTIQLPQNRVVKFSDVITFGPIKIMPKKSPFAHVEHYSYLVEWDGRRLFFTGDTEDTDILKNLPQLDMLFITPWFYRKAKTNDLLPDVRKIIIYHHKKNEIVPDCTGCIIPEQGQIIDIEKVK